MRKVSAAFNYALLPVASLNRSIRTANIPLGAADGGTLIEATSNSFTQTIGSANSLGAGWVCDYKNSGTGIVTIEPAMYAGELVPNGNFTTLSTDADVAVNGTFATDTDWTKTLGTTISGGKCNLLAVTNGIALQSVGSPIVADVTYKVTFTVSSYVGGAAAIYLGGSGSDRGSNNGTAQRGADGTFVDYVYANSSGTIRIQVNNSTDLKVDNIIVEPLSSLVFSGTGGLPFTFPTAAATFTDAGSNQFLGSKFSALTVGATYLFTFVLTGSNSSTNNKYIDIQLLGGSTVTLPVSRIRLNGTYRVSFTATAAHTSIRLRWPSDTFSGVIDTITLKQATNLIDGVAFILVRAQETLAISSDGSNFFSSSSSLGVLAKALLRCNAAATIFSSSNISSLTDTGTGVVTATLIANMSTTTYVVLATSGASDGGGSIVITTSSNVTFGGFVGKSFDADGVAADPENYTIALFGS